MSAAKAEHDDQDHEHAAINWFKVLDVAVWIAVTVVVVIGLEMLIGKLIRERISSGASKYLQKVTLGSSLPGDQAP